MPALSGGSVLNDVPLKKVHLQRFARLIRRPRRRLGLHRMADRHAAFPMDFPLYCGPGTHLQSDSSDGALILAVLVCFSGLRDEMPHSRSARAILGWSLFALGCSRISSDVSRRAVLAIASQALVVAGVLLR